MYENSERNLQMQTRIRWPNNTTGIDVTSHGNIEDKEGMWQRK